MDYVFDGLQASPYEENDATNPVSVYGKTKFAGERAIRKTRVLHLIFRTVWIYWTRGRIFSLPFCGLRRSAMNLGSSAIKLAGFSTAIAGIAGDLPVTVGLKRTICLHSLRILLIL
jgi:nucleoside-diphosphate-sugar epimerase